MAMTSKTLLVGFVAVLVSSLGVNLIGAETSTGRADEHRNKTD